MSQQQQTIDMASQMAKTTLNKMFDAYTLVVQTQTVDELQLKLRQHISILDRELLNEFLGTEQYVIVLNYVTKIRNILEGNYHEL
jgi:hypothetical protein